MVASEGERTLSAPRGVAGTEGEGPLAGNKQETVRGEHQAGRVSTHIWSPVIPSWWDTEVISQHRT